MKGKKVHSLTNNMYLRKIFLYYDKKKLESTKNSKDGTRKKKDILDRRSPVFIPFLVMKGDSKQCSLLTYSAASRV